MPIIKKTKVRPSTGNEPMLSGSRFFFTRPPAKASVATMQRNRLASITKPVVMLYQGVLVERLENALPLLAVVEVKANRISLSSCGPLLPVAHLPQSLIQAQEVHPRIKMIKSSKGITDVLIS